MTLSALVQLRSATATALLDYTHAVSRLGDDPADLPPYLGGRTLGQLYVPMDVLKTRRVVREVRDQQGKESKDREAEPGRNGPGQQVGSAARDAGEEGGLLYGEKSGRTEQIEEVRVAWEQEVRAGGLAGGPMRAAVLGPPGQGKTTLALMTGAALAKAAWQQIDSQAAGLEDVALPIIVKLAPLAQYQPPAGESPEDSLRRAVALQLGERGFAPRAVQYLCRQLAERRTWLFLDGLDEVDPENANLVRYLQALKSWQTNVVITARPYGYAAWEQRMPFDVQVYRLAPLSVVQAERFIDRFYAGAAQQSMAFKSLLRRSISIRNVSESPFLLTIACAANGRKALPTDVTRTQLYQQMMPLLFGSDDRAAEWAALLGEIGWHTTMQDARWPRIDADTLLERIQKSQNRPQPEGSNGSERSPRAQATILREELKKKRVLVPASEDKGIYVFPHRSVAAFLAATYLAAPLDLDTWEEARITREPLRRDDLSWQVAVSQIVDRKSWDPNWEGVIQFLCGLLEDPTPLLGLLATQKHDCFFRSRLCLAARCLPELQGDAKEISSKVAAEVFELAWSQIRSKSIHAHVKYTLPALATPAILARLADLLRDEDRDVRQNAVAVMGGMGAVGATLEILALLAELLRDGNKDVQSAAVRAVCNLGAAGATSAILAGLADLLLDTNWSVRADIARAVSGLGTAAATPEFLTRLAELLRDEDRRVQSAAADAVGSLGAAGATPEILACLVELLQCRDRWLREAAAKAVGGLGAAAATSEFLTRLAKLLRGEDRDMRSAALGAVSGLGVGATPEILALLAEFLRNEDSVLRSAAAKAAGALGAGGAPPENLARLAELLWDKDSDVRSAAAKAVGALGAGGAPPENLARLAELLWDKDSDVRSAAAKAVGAMGAGVATPEVLVRLAELLLDGDIDEGFAALEVVDRLGAAIATPEFLARLVKRLGNQSLWAPQDAADVVVGLGASGATPEVLACLAELLRDGDTNAQLSAAGAVGGMGGAGATPEILACLVELMQCWDNPWVRQAAAKAVCGLGAAAATPQILACMANWVRDPQLRSPIARAVGGLGAAAATPKILSRLAQLLRDRDYWVRSAAAQGFDRLMSGGSRFFRSNRFFRRKWEVYTVKQLADGAKL